MNASQANTLNLFLQLHTSFCGQGALIGEVIDIARHFPQDILSKRAIIHLGKLDGVHFNSHDPVAQYVSHFGVNTHWDKFNGRLHALHGILTTTDGKIHSVVA